MKINVKNYGQLTRVFKILFKAPVLSLSSVYAYMQKPTLQCKITHNQRRPDDLAACRQNGGPTNGGRFKNCFIRKRSYAEKRPILKRNKFL